jgi:hypothetical protein
VSKDLYRFEFTGDGEADITIYSKRDYIVKKEAVTLPKTISIKAENMYLFGNMSTILGKLDTIRVYKNDVFLLEAKSKGFTELTAIIKGKDYK